MLIRICIFWVDANSKGGKETSIVPMGRQRQLR